MQFCSLVSHLHTSFRLLLELLLERGQQNAVKANGLGYLQGLNLLYHILIVRLKGEVMQNFSIISHHPVCNVDRDSVRPDAAQALQVGHGEDYLLEIALQLGLAFHEQHQPAPARNIEANGDIYDAAWRKKTCNPFELVSLKLD